MDRLCDTIHCRAEGVGQSISWEILRLWRMNLPELCSLCAVKYRYLLWQDLWSFMIIAERNVTFGAWLCLILKSGQFGVYSDISGMFWNVILDIDWPIMRERKYSTEPTRRWISYKLYKDGRLTGLVKSCVGTVFWNTILKLRKRDE